MAWFTTVDEDGLRTNRHSRTGAGSMREHRRILRQEGLLAEEALRERKAEERREAAEAEFARAAKAPKEPSKKKSRQRKRKLEKQQELDLALMAAISLHEMGVL